MKPPRLHLGLELYAQPAWIPNEKGRLRTIEPDELPLSAGVVDALNEWAAAYTASGDAEGNPAPDESAVMAQLHERGIQLWKAVVGELGDRYEIRYDSPIYGESYRVHYPSENGQP